MDIMNKVVWITGASSGIGEAMAYQLSSLNATLILSGRRMEELSRVRSLCSNPDQVSIISFDLSDGNEFESKVSEAISINGRIDMLICNAGFSHRSLARDTSIEVYRKIMEINFFGTIQLSNIVMKHFLTRGSGQFVVLSSIATILTPPFRTGYCASKSALEAYYKSLRAELWETKIKILIVKPGSTKTAIAQNAITGDGTPFMEKDHLIENGMDVDKLVKKIINALKKEKEELVTGNFSQAAVARLYWLFPKFFFNAIKKIK